MTTGELFERERAGLVRHAYRMLGSMSDAEDIVQDAFVRWARGDRSAVRDAHAFLRATVTRLAVDHLRARKRSRVTYVGPWLPEPILVDEATAPEHVVTLAEDCSFAFLLALERLSPLERAAYLLHEALDIPFAEVAVMLERSEPSVRRLASRARASLRENTSRRLSPPKDAAERRDRFRDAVIAGDVQSVIAMLTDDVLLLTDGGGKRPAAINPLHGSDVVTRFLVGVAKKGLASLREMRTVTINGLPGWVFFGADDLEQTTALEFAPDGRIRAIYITRNPDKLQTIARQTQWRTKRLPSGSEANAARHDGN